MRLQEVSHRRSERGGGARQPLKARCRGGRSPLFLRNELVLLHELVEIELELLFHTVANVRENGMEAIPEGAEHDGEPERPPPLPCDVSEQKHHNTDYVGDYAVDDLASRENRHESVGLFALDLGALERLTLVGT